MRLRALHTSGYLDISAQETLLDEAVAFRRCLAPGEEVDVPEEYRSFKNIEQSIQDGLLMVVGTSNSDHELDTNNPHQTTASQVGADPIGTAASAVSAHNSSATAHGSVASGLSSHVSNTSNPHSVTAGQTGALALDQTTPQTVTGGKPVFDAGLVVGEGVSLTDVSGGLTVKNIGDDSYESVIAGEIFLHDGENAAQLTREGLTTLTGHPNDTSNPHQTTASQVGADPTGTAAAHNSASNAHDGPFLKLNQATPQTITGGVPISTLGLTIGDGLVEQARLNFNIPNSANNFSVIKFNNLRTGVSEITVDGVAGIPSGFFKASTGSANITGYNMASDGAARTIFGGGWDAEGYRRIRIMSDGQILWGGGAATQDTALSRSGVAELKSTGDLLLNKTNPTLLVQAGLTATKGRLKTYDVSPNSIYLQMGGNYDGAAWQRDDESKALVVWSLNTGLATIAQLRYAVAGTNPATLSTALDITTAGVVRASKIGALVDGTTGLVLGKADGTAVVVTLDTTNNRIGINKTPAATLDVATTDSANLAAFSAYSDNANGATLAAQKARGTIASPAAVQAGDTLFFWGARGYTSAGAFSASKAAITVVAAEAFTNSAQGTYMTLETTTTGGTTRAERVRISDNGNIGIGVTPSARLHVVNTTEQLRLGYDASNYLSATIGSTGSATLALTGTSPIFTFGQAVRFNGGTQSSDGSTGATGSFTSADGKTVTVKNGLITSIA